MFNHNRNRVVNIDSLSCSESMERNLRLMAFILVGGMPRAGGRRDGRRGGGVPHDAGPLLHRGPHGHAAAQRPHRHGAPGAARRARAARRRPRQCR